MAAVDSALDVIGNALQAQPPAADNPSPSTVDNALSVIQQGIAGKLPKVAPAPDTSDTGTHEEVFTDPMSGEPLGTMIAPNFSGSQAARDAAQFVTTAGAKAAGGLIDLLGHGPQSDLERIALARSNLTPQQQQEAAEARPGETVENAFYRNVVPEFVPQSGAGRLGLAATTGAMAGGPFGVGGALLGGASGLFQQGAAEAGLGPWWQLGASFLPAVLGKPVQVAGGATRDFLGSLGVGARENLGAGASGEPILATETQQRLAGQKLAGAASDVDAARASLVNPEPLIPGSQPTVGQVTGDTGLMSLERARMTANSEPFLERRFAQNAARTGAVEGLAPEGARPGAVGDFVSRALDELDAQGEARVAQAQQNAAARVQALGGTLNRDDYGAALRGELADANAAQKKTESAAWQAINPSGQLNISVEPIKRFANNTLVDLGTSDRKPMGIEESQIFSIAAGYPSVQQFSRLTDLRSRLLAEIRQERAGPGGGDAQALARMQALRQVMDDTIRGEAQKAADVGAPGTQALQTLSTQPPAPPTQVPPAGSTAFAPNGQAVSVQYRPVEASSLLASHNPDLTPNPIYPAELQPRERTRAVSELQVGTMAANLEPQRLGVSAEAGTGAPIVDRGGTVLSGNGRVAAIRQAFRRGNPSGQAYRQFVTSQFPEAANMREPVLVREITQEMTPQERVSFAQSSNASPLLSMGAGERAAMDAQRMPADILGLYRGGDLASAENREFVRAFLRSVPDQNELGALVTRDGQLSLEGQQRIRAALLQRAYGDSNLVASLAESGDENIRGFGNALADAAGSMAQLKGEVAAGRVPVAMDISNPLVEAANIVRQARATGVKLSDLVAQKDAFNPVSDTAQTILRSAYGEDLSGRLSRIRLGQLMRFFSEEAAKQSTEAQLFANPVTAADILAQGALRYGTTGQATETAGTSGAVGRYGPGAGAPGEIAYGSRAYAPGQGNAGAGQGGTGVLPQAPLVANFGPENAAAYRAAADLTRERKQTFNTGPVGEALRPGPQGTPFRITNSQVPGKFFNSSSHAAEDVQAFVGAAGSRPAALAALQDYAASDLLRSTRRPDGSLDPAKIETWLGKHRDALRAFPELADKARTVQSAERMALDAMSLRKAETDAFRRSEARFFLNGADPVDAVGYALREGQRHPGVFNDLVSLARRDPSGEALEGLQRGVVGFIQHKLTGNLLTGGDTATTFLRSDRFQTFIRNYAPLFERSGLFSPEQVAGMRAIAEDLQREARVQQATKLPLGSNTAQDLASAKAHGGEKSMLGRLILAEGLGELLEHMTGPFGKVAGWIGGYIIPRMRDAGMRNVDQLVDEALLNPSLARTLLEKIPANGPAAQSAAQRLGAQLARYSVVSGGAFAARNSSGLLGGPAPPQHRRPAPPLAPLLRGENLLIAPQSNSLLR